MPSPYNRTAKAPYGARLRFQLEMQLGSLPFPSPQLASFSSLLFFPERRRSRSMAGAAADPHHRSCSRSPSPELQQIPIAGATALPAPGDAPAPARLSRPPRCPSLLLPVGPPSPSPTATPPGGASARPALRRPRPLPSASAASPAVGRGCCYLTVQSPSPFGLCLLPCLLNWLGPFH